MALSQKLTDAFNKNAGKIVHGGDYALKFLIALDLEGETDQTRRECLDEVGTITRAIHEELRKKETYDALAVAVGDGSHGTYRAVSGEALVNGINAGDTFDSVSYFQFLLNKVSTATPKPMSSRIEDAFIAAINKTHDYREDVAAGKLKLRRHYRRFKK